MLKTKKIVWIIFAVILALPVFYVGSMLAICGFNGIQTKRSMSSAQEKLEKSPLPISERRIGQGTTCSKAYEIRFTVNKSYASSIEARNDIIQTLQNSEISAPEISDSPQVVAYSKSGATGGETPIEVLHNNYRGYDSHSYNFWFELSSSTPCEVVKADTIKVLCGGEDKDSVADKLFTSQAVTKVRIVAYMH